MTAPHAQPTIEVFLSFAKRDARQAEDLWDRLGVALASSPTYTWQTWAFTRNLLAGDDFDEQIHAALDNADVGIFAVSPGFLNSSYIKTHELPPFLAARPGKRIVPIHLKALATNSGLGGLSARQIFSYHQPYVCGAAPYLRDRWANALADELHKIAARDLAI